MKIICKDNYCRDNISDSLVCENVGKYLGNNITKFLNEKYGGDNSSEYFELVEDDYKLYVFEP